MIAGLNRYKNIVNKISIAGFIFGMLIILQTLGGPLHIIPSYSQYIFVPYILYSCYKAKINPIYFAFLTYIFIALALSNPNQIFNPWGRLCLFSLVILSTSSLFRNERLISFRISTFSAIASLSIIISIISFICFFLGINFMYSLSGKLNIAGGFGGITYQSMTLGIISSFATITMLTVALFKKRLLFWIICITCLGAVLFSASRGALLATTTGIISVLYLYTQSIKKFLKTLILIILIASISFPIWKSSLIGVTTKFENNIASGGIMSSRENKFAARISEFSSNPLIGIGFAQIDPELDAISGNGVVEPGSSWLSILSMTGLIGFIFFLIILTKSYCKALNSKSRVRKVLLCSLLIMFCFHMLIEGYIFAGGNPICSVLWCTVGIAYDS